MLLIFVLFRSTISRKKLQVCSGGDETDFDSCKKETSFDFVKISELRTLIQKTDASDIEFYLVNNMTVDENLIKHIEDSLFIQNVSFTSKYIKNYVIFDFQTKNITKNIEFNGCSVYYPNQITFSKILLQNSFVFGNNFRADFLSSDLQSRINSENVNIKSFNISFYGKIKSNYTYFYNYGELNINDLNEDVQVYFSGSLLIFVSLETRKNISIRSSFEKNKISVQKIQKQNIKICLFCLFISSTFQNTQFTLNLDAPTNFIMERSAWEGSVLPDFKLNQFSDSNITLLCDVIRISVYLLNGSKTNVMFGSKSVSLNTKVKIIDAYAHFSFISSITDKSEAKIRNVSCYNNSMIVFDKNLVAVIEQFVYRGLENMSVNVYGTVKVMSYYCYYGSAFFEKVISEFPTELNVYQPFGRVIIKNHITNDQILSVQLHGNGFVDLVTEEKTECIVDIQKTDNSRCYVIERNKFIKKINKGVYAFDLNEEITKSVYRVFSSITNKKKIEDEVGQVCIYENSDYFVYCNDFNLVYSNEQLLSTSLQLDCYGSLELYVAGKITNEISGVSDFYDEIKITSLAHNSSILLGDDNFYNLRIVNMEAYFTHHSTYIQNFTTFNSKIESVETLQMRSFYINTNDEKFNNNFECQNLWLIIQDNYSVMNIYDMKINFGALNVSADNARFINIAGENTDTKLKVNLYGTIGKKGSFYYIDEFYLYCYNTTSQITFPDSSKLFVFTKALPKTITFPGDVFFRNDADEFNASFIIAKKRCMLHSSKEIKLYTNDFYLNLCSSFVCPNVTISAKNFAFNKSMVNLTLKVGEIKVFTVESMSYVNLHCIGSCESLELWIHYYMGSVPFIFMDYDVSNLKMKMINIATTEQFFTDSVRNIKTRCIEIENLKSYSVNFYSFSWILNNDTRLFDIIPIKEEENRTSFFFMKLEEKEEEEGQEEKDKRVSPKETTIIIVSVFAAVLVIVVSSFVAVKLIRKKRIAYYVSSLSESLIEDPTQSQI